jgi:subtilisin family serine protease
LKKEMGVCLLVLVLSLIGPFQMKSEEVSKIDSTLGFLIALHEEKPALPEGSPLQYTLKTIEETNRCDVSIRFDHILSQGEISYFERLGIVFHRAEGKIARVGAIYGASVPIDAVQMLADDNSVEFIESAWNPAIHAPLDVSIPEVNADNVWALTDYAGRNITGQGAIIANFDTGVDVFHPDFWYADGSTYSWIDFNGNSTFDPGIDYVDLNGNSTGDANELLQFFDAQGTAGNNDGIFQADTDWLYNDSNNNSTRDYGAVSGYTESHPTYGEQIFLVNDSNGNNALDVGETLQALGTSKVYKTLNNGGVVRTRGVDLMQTDADTNGHGTGVAGILSGGTIGRKYVGIAPGATLLSADRIGNSEAVYISWAANNNADIMLYEFGAWVWEFMDGSSNLEQMIDTQAASGIVQVIPAGNLAGSGRHCQTPLPPGPTPLTFAVPALPTSIQNVYISVLWRTPANNLTFTLSSPTGAFAAFPPTTPGWQFVIIADGHTIWYNRVTSPRGTARYDFQITRNPVIAGGWTLTATNAGAPESIDGYIADDVTSWSGGTSWTAFVTDQRTVTWPATADSAITVASYSTRSRLGTVPIGALSLFSGRGTRIDSTSIMDIAAPGNYDVISAESKDTGASLIGKYQWFGGTSAAGPHVAGAAALLLQNRPWLVHTAIKTILQLTARTDGFTGATPNDNWGYGKLDCLAAVLYNSTPTVTVIYPNGGEIVSGMCNIAWNASDLDGDPLIVDIEYSDDNGATWYTIITGTSNTGSFLWNTNTVPEGSQYLIRITVSDGFGGTNQDQSDNVFVIVHAEVKGQSSPQEPLVNKWVRTLAQNRIKNAESLREEAYNYLEKVKEKGLDTSDSEIKLKEADELLEKAKIMVQNNPIPANNFAIKAIEIYETVIEELKRLLEDP